MNNGNMFPCLGSGYDINLSDKCNVDRRSYSKLGGTYDCLHMEEGSEEAKKYLGGGELFLVTEIECFKLNK